VTTEPRKASDILLELEKKLDIALNIIRTQDLNIKILSNKLNIIVDSFKNNAIEVPKFTVEAIDNIPKSRMLPTQVQIGDSLDEKNILFSPDDKLPLESEPIGFRRTSRPETFAGDDAYLVKPSGAVTPKYPVQVPIAPPGRNPNAPPPGREAEVVAPAHAKSKIDVKLVPEPKKQQQVLLQNAVPVMQRVVNAHGKSLFLADVEIIDLTTIQQVVKTRTNGTGKWMASLGIGDYRVIIRKLEAATKEKLEVIQEIHIDGSQSPFELQTVIIKS